MRWTQHRLFGLDIDEGRVVATELLRRRQAAVLKTAVFASNVPQLLENPVFKGGAVHISLPTQIVLFRSFYVPAALSRGRNSHAEIVAFLVRQNLPFKLEECYWDTFVWDHTLHFVAARKEMVDKYVAGIEELGLRCEGVSFSLAALYNILLYNYPEMSTERWAILHMRNSSSDLLLHEPKRLWLYPLSIGRKDFFDATEALRRLPLEVQRTFNAHYLQNPQSHPTPGTYFYVSGQECTDELLRSIKKELAGFEVAALDPLRTITAPERSDLSPQSITLSVGLGLNREFFAGFLSIDLIKAKVKRERLRQLLVAVKKLVLGVLCAGILVLGLRAAAAYRQYRAQQEQSRANADQVEQLLPQVNALKLQRKKLRQLYDFFEKKMSAQMSYLRVLALLAQNKSSSVVIRDFSATLRDTAIEVSIAGSALTYTDINDFLANLKKRPDIREVKVVASAFIETESKVPKPIDFKLRFEVVQ